MPSIVQSNSCSVGATACNLSLSGVTAGRALVILAASYGSTITTPSGYTLVFGVTNGSDPQGHLYAFIRENVPSGSHTPTLGTATGGTTGVLMEMRDVPTSSVLDGTASAADDSTTPYTTPSITIAADSILLGVLTHVSGTFTLTESNTLIFEQEDSSTHMAMNAQDRGAGTGLAAGSYTLSWTAGGSILSTVGILALKHLAEGGGGGFTPKSRRTLEFMSRVGRRSSGP